MSEELVIWGGTGNFKVLCELLKDTFRVVGYFDNDPLIPKEYRGIPHLGGSTDLDAWLAARSAMLPRFMVSMGHGKGAVRLSIHDDLLRRGLRPITAVHERAFLATTADLGEGSMVFAQAAVCADVHIGRGCILNTRCSVDHESVLEDGVTIGPGATITGLVHVERCADIYSGAVVLPRLRIGEGAVVGAGAVVRHDVEPYTVVVGNPARVLRRIEP